MASYPVKLSAKTLLEVRLEGQAEARSIASQVEYWLRLGKILDRRLRGHQVARLLHAEQNALDGIAFADTAAGRQRAIEFLNAKPFPHYQTHETRPDLVVRIDADGKRTTGRFVNRKFERVALRATPQAARRRAR
jgi:hypothetical protein